MQCFAITQCSDTQVLAKFIKVPPMTDAAIGLNFGMLGFIHRKFAPLQANVRPLTQDSLLELWRLFHEVN
jgi:hypothetical protein